MKISKEFIAAIPKADLHMHLDGSVRIPTLIELAKKEKVELPSYTEEGLRKTIFKSSYKNLGEYLQGFYYINKVLQKRENIERVAYELALDNIAEGVRYMEVRFAPQLHTDKITMEDALRAVASGLNKAKAQHNKKLKGGDVEFHFGIIACAHRNIDKNMAQYYKNILDVFSNSNIHDISALAALELARAVVKLVEEENCPIVAFDLAGQEDGYPAEDYKKAYQYVHEHFIRKTVHAGEAYGPESIFQAITDCHANRIGHGTFLFDYKMIKDKSIKNPKKFCSDLANYIASERIGVEVCLTSNLQTNPKIKSIKDHPVKTMIEHGISVSIATDNRLISGTTVGRELGLLADNIALTQQGFKNIVIAGFKGGFFHGSYAEKKKFVKSIVLRYNELEKQFFK